MEDAIANIVQSETFANLSVNYVKYLTVTSLSGLALGLVGGICYILDRRAEKKEEKFSYFHNYCLLMGFTIGGATAGIMYPAIIITAPFFYVFGSNGGKVISSIILLSSSAAKNKKKKSDDKPDKSEF